MVYRTTAPSSEGRSKFFVVAWILICFEIKEKQVYWKTADKKFSNIRISSKKGCTQYASSKNDGRERN